MKVLIGITQDLEKTRDFIAREFRKTGTAVEAGPFLSLKDASRWEQFMSQRKEGSTRLDLPQRSAGDSLWYGIVMEWEGSGEDNK